MAGACRRVSRGLSRPLILSLSPTPSFSQLPIFPLLPKPHSAWHPLLVGLDNGIAELGAVLGDGQPVVLAEEGQQERNQNGFFLEDHVLEFLEEGLVGGQDLGHRGAFSLVHQPFQSLLSQAKQISNLVVHAPHNLRRRVVAVGLHNGEEEFFLAAVVALELV